MEIQNFVLGPFYDLKRMVVGAVATPPPSRVVSEQGLAAARAVLTVAGCTLTACTEENLHTWPTSLSPDRVYDLAAAWQLWPPSAFFACPTTQNGESRFAYRLYSVIPVVKMKLKTAVKPRYIIYDIEWGIGRGGYHTFLIDQTDTAGTKRTTLSIFTTFPPSWLFLEGLHDQTNHDIYHKLTAIQDREDG